MNRMVTILAVSLLAMASMTLGAQEAAASKGNGLVTPDSALMTSSIYPLRVDIVKIYSHAQGYRVVYRKGEASFGEAYLPITWFVPGGKGVLVQGRGRQYPYMVIYYTTDGAFSHVKLFVAQSIRDPSWARLEGDPGDRFKVDTLKLEF